MKRVIKVRCAVFRINTKIGIYRVRKEREKKRKEGSATIPPDSGHCGDPMTNMKLMS